MKKLILVEDDERLRSLIAEFLTEQSFEVVCKSDGSGLLQYFRRCGCINFRRFWMHLNSDPNARKH